MVAALGQRAGAAPAMSHASRKAPPEGSGLGGEPLGVGEGQAQERHPHSGGQGLSSPRWFIIYKPLSSLCSNSLQRVFNISETDESSIAQADSYS